MQRNKGKEQTRDLFKKIRDTKGIFHAQMGPKKDWNGMNLMEAEDIKKRWQEYTEELYKKDLHGNYFKCRQSKCSNQKTQIGWMDTKRRPLSMQSTRDPPETKGDIQTESKELEKDISYKWKSKESMSSNIRIR